MPRPRVDKRYVEQVGALAEEGKRPPEIARLIRADAQLARRNDAPSERSVRRLYDAHVGKSPEERRESAFFRWPKSMLNGFVPWEASRVALDLLRLYDTQANASDAWLISNGVLPVRRDRSPATIWARPTNRTVRWVWRVTLAAPSLSLDQALRLAALVESADALSSEEFDVPTEELALAYALDHDALQGRITADWFDLIDRGPAALNTTTGEPLRVLKRSED
jgi:hypothetical protein